MVGRAMLRAMLPPADMHIVHVTKAATEIRRARERGGPAEGIGSPMASLDSLGRDAGVFKWPILFSSGCSVSPSA